MSDIEPATGALTPYICPRGCADAIAWYVEVLGAVERSERFVDPDGRVGHAEVDLGGSTLMLSDAYPDFDTLAPETGATATTYALHLEVPDVDATVALARERGAVVRRPPADQFDGSRRATIVDPFGVRWMLSTEIRGASEAEARAAREDFATRGAQG